MRKITETDVKMAKQVGRVKSRVLLFVSNRIAAPTYLQRGYTLLILSKSTWYYTALKIQFREVNKENCLIAFHRRAKS